MRRTTAGITLLVLFALVLAGCTRLVPQEEASISVYATVYPIYALADAVMDGIPNAELHCLVQPQDGCLRSYQLSDWDGALLEASADAVLLGGRGLESFESALLNWNGSAAVSAVLYNLELYNDVGTASTDDQDSHLEGANPHLYMSIDGAKSIVESIGASMLSLDPSFANRYDENVENSIRELDELYKKTHEIAENIAGKRVILMNEALIYVARDYGLEVADWIDRESGTAFYDKQLANCLDRLAESEAQVILIERQAPQGFVEALESAGFLVARIDILSTHREGEGFQTYIEAQLANAEAIRDAFDRTREGKES